MAAIFGIIAGVALILIALYYYYTSTFNYWKKRGIPGPKPVPVFGNLLPIILATDSLGGFVNKLYHKYRNEPMVGLFMSRTPFLLIQDPDLIKTVLIKDFPSFANRGFLKSEIAEPLSQHLFLLDVRRWRPLRSKFTPVFSSGKLKGTFSLILECTKNLEKYLDTLAVEGKPIDMRDVCVKYTTDVIGSCAFGIEMNNLSGEENEFRRMGKQFFAINWKATLKWKIKEWLPKLYDNLGYILPYDEVTKFFIMVTHETLKHRKENNIVRPDFMNVLLELKNQPGKIDIQLDDKLLAAQAFVFFVAGFETSSITLTHALYELALYPEVQKKLREEIKEFDAKNEGQWLYENIQQMSYLDKVFKETLRKYPPLTALIRQTTEPYTFEDAKLSLRKGFKIWIPVYAIHMDPAIYPEPEKFDPERFTNEAVKARHPMHYLPFGDGPRNCIGARFALYQVKVGLIKILRKYKVDVCEKTPIPYRMDEKAFLTAPKDMIYLNVVKDEN